MLLRRVLYLLLFGFMLRVLTSCIGLWGGGDPVEDYFDWGSLTVETLDMTGEWTQVEELDTMPPNAISFRLSLWRTYDEDTYVSVFSPFASLYAWSVAYVEIPNQTVDSISVVTLFDLTSEYLAQSEVSSLFVSAQSGWEYDLYEPLGVMDENLNIHLKPRLTDVDSVCFKVSVFLSDDRVLSDTTDVIIVCE